MGFFSVFSTTNSSDNNWPGLILDDVSQLSTLVQASFTKPQLIFKHSTRCSISRFVLEDFKPTLKQNLSRIDAYYLDLLNFRTLSNAVATQLDVIHQSPQLIIIKNGVVVEYASHDAIRHVDLQKF